MKIVFLALLVFVANVLTGTLVSFVVPQFFINDSFFGMSLPVALGIIGIGAYLFLWRKLKAPVWIWGILTGSIMSNLFERFWFGSVFDWIPCGIGYCNTADIGILFCLVFLMGKIWRNRK